MDAADMIQEKRLKQGFIIATLASTIAGTFTTAINLFDRVNEKRRNRRQRKLDKGQDKRIKELERRLDEKESGNGHRHEPNRQADRQPERIGDDDLRGSLEQGGPLVKREYDRQYAAMGPRFAEGDLIAQTQLQSQIITLQSTVIKLLEDALFTGKNPDMAKLYNASEFARHGAIKALREQSQRLQQALPIRRPIGLMRRTSSTPSLRSSTTTSTIDTNSILSTDTTSDLPTSTTATGYRTRNPDLNSHGYYATAATSSNPPPRKALTYQTLDHHAVSGEEYQKSGPLFCRYAKDLQQTRQPLDERFFSSSPSAPGCPACGAKIPVTSAASSSSSSPSSSSPGGNSGTATPRGYLVDKEVVVTERITRPRSGGNSMSVTLANGAPVTEFVKRFEDRTYLLTARFLAKCHRPGAEASGGKGYACYLCWRNRDRDTLLKTVRGLVGHVRDKHDVGEYEREVDIRDVTPTMNARRY